MKVLNKYSLSLFKIMPLLFLVNGSIAFAQNPYFKTNSGIGQYGYLEKTPQQPCYPIQIHTVIFTSFLPERG